MSTAAQDKFFSKLEALQEENNRQALLRHIDAHKRQISDLVYGKEEQYPVLMTLVHDQCTQYWTAHSIRADGGFPLNYDLAYNLETLLVVAKQLIKYDPDHIQRRDREGSSVISVLFDWVEVDLMDGPPCIPEDDVEAILYVIMELYKLCDTSSILDLERCSLVRIVRIAGNCLERDPTDPSSFQTKICQFLKYVSTVAPDAFLEAKVTPLLFLCREAELTDDIFAQLAWTTLECNPEAAKEVSTYDTVEELPLHAAMKQHTSESTEPFLRALHQANPTASIMQDSNGNFPIALGPPLSSEFAENFIPHWHIDAYIQAHDQNRALPDSHPDKMSSNINALHLFFSKLGDFGHLVKRMKAFLTALPPNHPMVMEWNKRGVTPLHLLLRQKQSTTKQELISILIQRHPDAIQFRTKTKMHPIQSVISHCSPKQRKESVELLDTIYLMIRSDPGHTMENMRGDPLPVADPPKKKKKRKRY